MAWRGGRKAIDNLGSNPPLPTTGCQTLGKSHNLHDPGALNDKMQGMVQAVLKLCLWGLGVWRHHLGVKQDEQLSFFCMTYWPSIEFHLH